MGRNVKKTGRRVEVVKNGYITWETGRLSKLGIQDDVMVANRIKHVGASF